MVEARITRNIAPYPMIFTQLQKVPLCYICEGYSINVGIRYEGLLSDEDECRTCFNRKEKDR